MRMFLSWMLSLIAGTTLCIGLTMLALLPIQAEGNRELLERVKEAAAYQAATGHLPQKYQYRPKRSGIGSMWVDRIDGCDPNFVPPRSDRFVIGFWQGNWWNCYGYPSGVTTLRTSIAGYLVSEAGLEILINWVVAAIAFWGAGRLRRGGGKGKDMGLAAKMAWFGAWMTSLNLFYAMLDSADDQFVYAPGPIKWFDQVFGVTIYPFEQFFLGIDRESLLNNITMKISNQIGTSLHVPLWISIVFLFWFVFGYLTWRVFEFAIRAFRRVRRTA